MSNLLAIPETIAADAALVMCNECGSTRTTRSSAKAPRLRCVTCGRATAHGRPFSDHDWRERDNHERTQLTVVDQLDVLRSLGANVRERDPQQHEVGAPCVAAVYWYIATGRFDVDVYGRHPALHRAMGKLQARLTEPTEQEWFVTVQAGAVVASMLWVTGEASR